MTLRAVVAKHVQRLSAPVVLDADGRFECPRHAGALTIAPAFCARLYKRGLEARRTRDAVEHVAIKPCLGCAIGAAHAGLDPAAGRAVEVFVPGQLMHVEPRAVRQRRSRAGAQRSAEESRRRSATRERRAGR